MVAYGPPHPDNGPVTRARRPAAVTAASLLWLGAGLAYAPVAPAAPPTVTGTKDPAGAPVLPDGDSVDTLGGRSDKQNNQRHYRVERGDLSSQVFIGAAMSVPDVGTDGMSSSTEAVRYQSCLSGPDANTGGVGRAVISSGGNAMEGCPQQQAVTLELERYSLEHFTSGDKAAPVLLRVTRVPAITNLNELPASLPKMQKHVVNGAPGTITPGPAITEPAAVTPGTAYTLEIQSARAQFFAVDVGWGQSVQVQVETNKTPESEAVKDKAPSLSVDVLGPTLNRIGDLDASLNSPAKRQVMVPPVVWRSYTKGGAVPFLAGRNIIAVGLSQDPFGKPVTTTYTLTVTVDGVPTGEPRFTGPNTTSTGAGPTATPVRRYVAVGLGAAGALMLIAAGVIWNRARA